MIQRKPEEKESKRTIKVSRFDARSGDATIQRRRQEVRSPQYWHCHSLKMYRTKAGDSQQDNGAVTPKLRSHNYSCQNTTRSIDGKVRSNDTTSTRHIDPLQEILEEEEIIGRISLRSAVVGINSTDGRTTAISSCTQDNLLMEGHLRVGIEVGSKPSRGNRKSSVWEHKGHVLWQHQAQRQREAVQQPRQGRENHHPAEEEMADPRLYKELTEVTKKVTSQSIEGTSWRPKNSVTMNEDPAGIRRDSIDQSNGTKGISTSEETFNTKVHVMAITNAIDDMDSVMLQREDHLHQQEEAGTTTNIIQVESRMDTIDFVMKADSIGFQS
ncbi:hypothetical protein GCK72_000896 [Caenorhabditis remanei]|uniref:Uncharacterized protein n=1 Tax=Caenorhabditis remanei TaxID=31234 RepID=A0A6A5HS93_CAERE|nr:hypothetical protein GCK72_000896 [Caenorhabditis remanei]KAF1769083.1 hypothetical protein GCK72_000896 [Caenorhabditis remanei]